MAEQEEKLAQLNAEKESLEATHPLSAKLLTDEIERIQSGGLENISFIELHQPKTKVEFRVKIPIKEFPQVNFVGKILGQGGENVKRLQEACGCRIAVLGRGSMKDKNKQEELRRQGGKYAHLNHDLHVWFEAVGHPIECYQRLAHAFSLVHPFLVPDPNDMQQQQQQQQQNGGMMRGGMAGGRGGPRGRGMRGGPGGAAGGGGRGGMMMGRGGGGAPRGGTGMRPPMRGGVAGRGAARGQMASPMGGRGAGGRGAGGMGRGAAPAMRGARGGAQQGSMLNPQAQGYPSEAYQYETGTAGYGAGGMDESAGGYEDPSAAGAGYGGAGYGGAGAGYGGAGAGYGAADTGEAYQYESYGQGAETGYGGYETGWDSSMGGGGGDASGYGKAAAPTRGGLANYRTRPY